MSGSVAEAAALDRRADGSRPGSARRRSRVFNDHHYDRTHLQWQAQQKRRVALASVSAVTTSEIGLHRALVRRCADRSQVGDHCRSLHSQVSERSDCTSIRLLLYGNSYDSSNIVRSFLISPLPKPPDSKLFRVDAYYYYYYYY